jgi:hypothetical protein
VNLSRATPRGNGVAGRLLRRKRRRFDHGGGLIRRRDARAGRKRATLSSGQPGVVAEAQVEPDVHDAGRLIEIDECRAQSHPYQHEADLGRAIDGGKIGGDRTR